MEEEAQGNQRRPWTRSEDKDFEAAIVHVPEGTPNRWLRIATVLPGRSPEELEQHYNDLVFDVWDIDMGLVPLPDYPDELQKGDPDELPKGDPDELPKGDVAKVPARAKVEAVRRKGQPWTQNEHRLFLLGLQLYNKGDWRSISRNVVVTRTPTQVASHAQKYFIRQNAPNKSRRSSIHDTPLSPMQASDEGGSLGYADIANVNIAQVGSPGHGKSVANTNNEQISPPSQITNHIGCSSGSYITAHDNGHMMLPHYNSPQDGGLSSIGYIDDIHINAGSSLARSPNSCGSMGNCNFTNMYHQECPIGYNNGSPPRNNRMISLQNQFSVGSTSSSANMNDHIISPQPQIPLQISPPRYYSSSMISCSVSPPTHLHKTNGHLGSVSHSNTSDGPNLLQDQPPN